METIAVFYRVAGESDGGPSNLCFLQVREGRELYLLDLLQSWAASGTVERICYSFFAEDSSAVPGARRLLPSVTSVLPVHDEAVHLYLVPAAAPPTGYFPAGRDSSSTVDADQSIALDAGEERALRSSVPSKQTAPKLLRPVRSENSDLRQEEELRHVASTASGPTEDTVVALANAAATATEVTSQAARSLFSFAAKSIKTVVNNVASLTGQIQVGNHKIVVVKELAQGGFGTVFLVKDAARPTELYAMKQMICQTKEQVDDAHVELRALQKFSGHENIIHLIDHASVAPSKGQHRQILLLFPFYSAGTAWDMVADAMGYASRNTAQDQNSAAPPCNWPFPERAALLTIMGIARALSAMHSEGLSHRDVKPHNILISDSFEPILMDLGSVAPCRVEVRNRLAALKAEDEASVKCSAPYRAPELTQVANNCDIDEKIDVWSLGCTLYCLAFGNSPFETPKEGILKLAILNGKYSIPARNINVAGVSYSNNFVELINQTLQVEASARPDMDAIVDTCASLLS